MVWFGTGIGVAKIRLTLYAKRYIDDKDKSQFLLLIK